MPLSFPQSFSSVPAAALTPSTTTTPANSDEPSTPHTALGDELEAINSIYGPDTLTLLLQPTKKTTPNITISPHQAVSAILHLPNSSLSFQLCFPAAYPAQEPPTVLGVESVRGGKRGEGKGAVGVLREVLKRVWTPGQVCVFELIEEVGAVLGARGEEEGDGDGEGGGGEKGLPRRQQEPDVGEEDKGSTAGHDEQDKQQSHRVGHPSLQRSLGDEEHLPASKQTIPHTATTTTTHPPPSALIPHWTLSSTVTEKKSVFLARAAPIPALPTTTTTSSFSSSSSTLPSLFLTHLLATDKKAAHASHNIAAWRVRNHAAPSPTTKNTPHAPTTSVAAGAGSAAAPATFYYQDHDSDGETAAGSRLLHLLQAMEVWDVVVVVSRWYGGVHLGPDRFRIINSVAREALVRGGFVVVDQAGAKGPPEGTGAGEEGEEVVRKGKKKKKKGREGGKKR